MQMSWHWLVVFYMFLGGLGAGAYLTSFAAEKGLFGTSDLNKAGYYLAAPLVAMGTLFLVFDLGQGLSKPWLLAGLFRNFRSVMTLSSYILTLFIIVGMIQAWYKCKKRTAPAALTWAGAILAIATAVESGILLSVLQAVPFWNTGLLPLLFIFSAMSTGIAVVKIFLLWRNSGEIAKGREEKIQVILIIFQLVLTAIYFGLMSGGINGSVGAESAALAVSGHNAIVFWGLFIGLGLLFPLLVPIVVVISQHPIIKATKRTEPGNELAATKEEYNKYLMILTNLAVLTGGVALRAVIIFCALPTWDGVTLLL